MGLLFMTDIFDGVVVRLLYFGGGYCFESVNFC